MSDEAATTRVLDAFLTRTAPKCEACKAVLDHAVNGECPACGEIVALEVRSLRQPRWADRGAIPVSMAIGISVFIALRLTLVAGLIWYATYTVLRGTGIPMPPETRRVAFGVTAAAAAALGIAVLVWLKRRALLRARLRIRIAVLLATLAEAGACMLGAWLATRQ
jgi:predicted RNA-binding Zn-ribbon protein involved in translation (DUF1610 family)